MAYEKVPAEDADITKPEAPPPPPPATFPIEAPGQWSTGLFDCGSQPGGPALCLVSCFLPCVQYGTIVAALPPGTHPYAGSFRDASWVYFMLDILPRLLDSTCLPGAGMIPLSSIIHMKTRAHLREKYSIRGTTCKDFWTAWCCTACALAQESREIILRNAAEQQQAASLGHLYVPGPTAMFGHVMLHPPHAAAAMMAPPLPIAPAVGMPVPAVPVVAQLPPPPSPLPVQQAPKPEKEGYEPVHMG